MKFIKVLIILMALSFVLNRSKTKTRFLSRDAKPTQTCKIILVDNDSALTGNNAEYFGTTQNPKLNCDLSQDVREVVVENVLPTNYQNECQYEFKACADENYVNCKTYTGKVKPGNKSLLVNDHIKKMKSFKVQNTLLNINLNNDCRIYVNDNDNMFNRQSKFIGRGEGQKSSFIYDLDNDINIVVISNESTTQHCTCDLKIFHDTNYKGTSYTNTLSARPKKNNHWYERKGENWKVNISSITWRCSNLESGKIDYHRA